MSELEDSLRSLLERGRKVEAIGVYRRETGAGPEDAVSAIERLERGEGLPARTQVLPADPELENQVAELMAEGRQVEAIRLHREHAHTQLTTSKKFVESLAARRGISTAPRVPVLQLVFLAVIVAVLIVWLAS